jgi:hypothetical protein
MNVIRSTMAATLFLLGGLTPARGDDVLVPGNPPLTQETVSRYQDIWEWYCDVKMTPGERRQHTKLQIEQWKKWSPDATRGALDQLKSLDREWREVQALKDAEQDVKRSAKRIQGINALRKETNDPAARFLVSVYDAAYKPGGTRNPVLVEGDPPLTQSIVDLNLCVVEMMFDTRLTDEERRAYRQLCVENWTESNRAWRRAWAKAMEAQVTVPGWNLYARNLARAFQAQPAIKTYRARIAAGEATDGEHWLVEKYDALMKPGSARNPVLVNVDPPLTQIDVDRYRDYAEVVLDLSTSGGFSGRERQVLQDYLVKEWKTMTGAERKAQLAVVKEWFDRAGEGASGNAVLEVIRAMRTKGVIRLQGDSRQSSKWLLEVLAQERKKEAQQSESQPMALEPMRPVIR